MALAMKIHLQNQALTPNQTVLTHLLERAVAGDTAAFEQIMIHSQQRVTSVSWRLLGNEADVRDASQEVFLRVFKYLHKFNQDQDFFAWIYTITVNVCRDISRKRRQHEDRFTGYPEDSEQGQLAPMVASDNAESALIQNQQRELIARALDTLPEKERATIVLRDMEGLSTEEVARIMKSTATTVRSQISSGRKKIKAYCDQQLKRKGASHGL